jgi:hypothetical protein
MSGGGGISSSLIRKLTDLLALMPLVDYVNMLKSFAKTPGEFIRSRLYPLLLGGIIGFMLNVADAVAAPFLAIVDVLEIIGISLIGAISPPLEAITELIRSLMGAVLAASAGFGPLQPFVLLAIGIVASYLAFRVGQRALAAGFASLPGLSGIGKLIFG